MYLKSSRESDKQAKLNAALVEVMYTSTKDSLGLVRPLTLREHRKL